MKKGLLVAVLLLVVLIIPFGCKPPAEAPPPSPGPLPAAEFEVVSLNVMPPGVRVGETVSVTAEVRNDGASEGTYTAVLTIDGAEVERKDITVAARATEIVTFSLVRETPGTYEVAIGGLASTLVVKKEPVAKEVELKYDDGTAEGCASAGPRGGYLVDFSPPGVPFSLKKVRIYGGIWGSGWEGRYFRVEIWGKDQKVLYSASYPVTKFAIQVATWVEIEIPDVKVSDKFYVHILTGTGRMKGIHLGADDSVVNEHSNVTVWTPEGATKIRADWPYRRDLWFGDKSKVNWMIRVVGTITVPAS